MDFLFVQCRRIAAGRGSCSLVLVFEALLLVAAVVANDWGVWLLLPALILAIAMGVQNAAIHRAGGISVALTYVTGTLVHFGRAIAGALTGTSSLKEGWPYLALWATLVIGAALGAWTVVSVGAGWAIGFVAMVAAVLAVSLRRNRLSNLDRGSAGLAAPIDPKQTFAYAEKSNRR